MRILVVNVNTSPTMTSVIGEAARRCATAGTEIEVLRPYFGPEAVDCNFESYLSAVAVMDRVTAYDGHFDAVVLAGFGEHGRDGIAELIEQPVVEICEASAHVAMMIGRCHRHRAARPRRRRGRGGRQARRGDRRTRPDDEQARHVRAARAQEDHRLAAVDGDGLAAAAGRAGMSGQHLTDLASRWLGGSVVAASDESFGDKENLLNPAAPLFEPGRYGNRGEIVDGWETRRRRQPGNDWAIVRLGTPGVITSVQVDTSFFTGNFPGQCLIEACGREGYPGPEELSGPGWAQIVPRSPLAGDALNAFAVPDPRRFTHVRLSVFPDGGVARLRVLGQVVPDPRGLERLTIDLASQEHGGLVVASSDDFYTAARTLNRPDLARSMGEGWETRRRRDDGPDFVILELGLAGRVRQLIIDTAHFRYNASAAVAVYGCDRSPAPPAGSPAWTPLLDRVRLQPDTRHVFAVDDDRVVAAIRLDAFPDGGVSRVRVIGSIDPAARRRAGYRWFNSLPASQALICLANAGLPAETAAAVVARRPLPQDWPGRSRPPGALAAGEPRADVGVLKAMLEGPAGLTG